MVSTWAISTKWMAGWSDWPRNNVPSPAICLSLSFPRNLSVSVDGCMVAVKALGGGAQKGYPSN